MRLCYVIWRNAFDEGLVLSDQTVMHQVQPDTDLQIAPMILAS